jgi:uncharacterized membrane protein
MVPLIELRGAVPIGIGLCLPEWLVLIIALFGNLIPVPFIFFFAHRILEIGKNSKFKKIQKFCTFCLKKGEDGGKKLLAKTGNNIYFALALFVGIPIPGTGAWTGTLAASMLNLDRRHTIVAISAGLVLASTIMMLLSLGLFKFII